VSNKYDSYKDSGIEWIGEIPSHWDLGKIKYTDTVIMGQSPLSDDCNSEGNGLPFLQGNAEFGKLNPTPKQYCEIPNKIAEINDVLLSVRAPVGALNIANQNFGIGRGLCAIRQKNSYYKFIYYWLLYSNKELDSISTGSTFKAISLDDVKNINFPSIDINEQTRIANYLDHKTTQIDHLIAKKEQFIHLLEEERVAVINQAVTKGLDQTVPMKDSGIEWLSEIPVHWEVAKFNLFISIRHGHQFMNYDFTENGVKVVKITQLHRDGHLDLSKCSFVASEQLENYQSILIKEKDILMCLTGGTIGKIIRVGVVNEPLLQNYRVGHFSSGDVKKISDDYIFWLMSSESIISQIFFQMRETGQPNIGMDDFGRMRITIPPLIEQEKIVKHINKKTAEISEILIKSKQEIELLKEYKTALISEVVTGKVDVRNEKLN
jgi:type I restriction enzyme S subunit